MTNPFLKQRGKLFIIPASPSDSDETEPLVFKFDLRRRQNFKKFLVLGNNKKRNERKIAVRSRQSKTETEVEPVFINDLNKSTDDIEIFDNQSQKQKENSHSKLDFGYDSLMSEDTTNTAAINLSGLFSDACKKTHSSENNKSSSQEKSIDDSSETFYIKRKLWPKSICEKYQNASSLKCDLTNCSNVENMSYKPGSVRRKTRSCNYTMKILELKKQFQTLVKQLKSCETDEDKCSVLVKIVFCCLKGSFSHQCDRLVPKIILMIKDMCRNEDSKLCCSIVIFALTKAELISNFSDILALVISLMKTDTVVPSDKQQDKRNEIKTAKQLDILKFIEENENLEILNQYNTTDFALDCLLKFTAYSKTDVYKSELRCMGGLDIVLDIVNSQAITIWNEQLASEIQLYNITKLEHCLNILQNVIFKIPENQSYIVDYRNFQLLQNVTSVLQFLQQKFLLEVSDKIPATECSRCLSSILKLLINITYRNVQGSIHIGAHGEIINIILFFLVSIFHLKQEADVTLLCLGLIANLIMTSKDNLHQFTAIKVKSSGFQNEVNSVVALSEIFQNLRSEVQKLEADTEKLLFINAIQNSPSVEDFEDNVSTVFHSAGHHMEHSMMCSFLALILGYAIEDNKENAYVIKSALPIIQFDEMATILKEFHSFVGLTDLLENMHLQEIQSIVDVLFSL